MHCHDAQLIKMISWFEGSETGWFESTPLVYHRRTRQSGRSRLTWHTTVSVVRHAQRARSVSYRRTPHSMIGRRSDWDIHLLQTKASLEQGPSLRVFGFRSRVALVTCLIGP